jgi:hypothetical protein
VWPDGENSSFWASPFMGYVADHVFKVDEYGMGYYRDYGIGTRDSHRENWTNLDLGQTAESAIRFWQDASEICVYRKGDVPMADAVSHDDIERAEAFLSSVASDIGIDNMPDSKSVMRQSQELTAESKKQRKKSADDFNAAERMWEWPLDVLTAQQGRSATWTLAERAARFPWVLPVVVTSRWHVNATVSETLEYCKKSPDVVTYESLVTEHVPVLWYYEPQIQRSISAGISAPVASGPEPFCKYWHCGTQHFGVGPADVYHGFGFSESSSHATNCYMPESMFDLFFDGVTWQNAHVWVDQAVAEVERVKRG